MTGFDPVIFFIKWGMERRPAQPTATVLLRCLISKRSFVTARMQLTFIYFGDASTVHVEMRGNTTLNDAVFYHFVDFNGILRM